MVVYISRKLARDTRFGLEEMASELLTRLPPATVVDVLLGAAVILGDDRRNSTVMRRLDQVAGRKNSKPTFLTAGVLNATQSRNHFR